MELNIRKGNAVEPNDDGSSYRFIVHCCNDIGGWGSGFVLAISARWPKPEAAYREWNKADSLHGFSRIRSVPPFRLGQIQVVEVAERLAVVNLIGQRSTGTSVIGGVELSPVRYEAFYEGFLRMRDEFDKHDSVSVHMPRMGCGLAGGTWDKVEEQIVAAWDDLDIPVTVYDFQG